MVKIHNMSQYYLTHLKELESEAIFVIREVVAQFEKPALLFSGGKDSYRVGPSLGNDIGQTSEISQIIGAVMCRPIRSGESCPVKTKIYR